MTGGRIPYVSYEPLIQDTRSRLWLSLVDGDTSLNSIRSGVGYPNIKPRLYHAPTKGKMDPIRHIRKRMYV